MPELPPLAERVETALRQFHLAAQDKGEHIAPVWRPESISRGICAGWRTVDIIKKKISSISSMDEIESI